MIGKSKFKNMKRYWKEKDIHCSIYNQYITIINTNDVDRYESEYKSSFNGIGGTGIPKKVPFNCPIVLVINAKELDNDLLISTLAHEISHVHGQNPLSCAAYSTTAR